MITAPPRGPLSRASTDPPRSCTASRTMVRPRPVPRLRVVWPGSQMSDLRISDDPGTAVADGKGPLISGDLCRDFYDSISRCCVLKRGEAVGKQVRNDGLHGGSLAAQKRFTWCEGRDDLDIATRKKGSIGDQNVVYDIVQIDPRDPTLLVVQQVQCLPYSRR